MYAAVTTDISGAKFITIKKILQLYFCIPLAMQEKSFISVFYNNYTYQQFDHWTLVHNHTVHNIIM